MLELLDTFSKLSLLELLFEEIELDELEESELDELEEGELDELETLECEDELEELLEVFPTLSLLDVELEEELLLDELSSSSTVVPVPYPPVPGPNNEIQSDEPPSGELPGKR